MNLQENKPQPVYDCTQQELYAIGRLMWASCLENETDFAALKPKYTAVFINGKIAAVATAEMLPDADARTEPAKTARAILVQKGAVCLANWQALKRYIFTAYKADKTVLDAKLSAAGANYYTTASKEDWEDLKGLVNSGSGFITGHTSELLADDNMPVGFPAQFETDRNLFVTTYELFKDKEQDSEEGTTDKIEANNALYKDMMEMAADGVHIYRKHAAKRERFVWVKVKELVSSEPGNSGEQVTIQGVVRDSVTLAPLADVEFDVGGTLLFRKVTAATC
jgi:hypothetical protein